MGGRTIANGRRSIRTSCYSLIGLAFIGLQSSCGPLGTPLTPVGRVCHTNADCRAPEFCQKEQGNCAGTGHCQERPRAIGPALLIMCGCDGHTYSNPLAAAHQGIPIAHSGQCEGESGQPERRLEGDHPAASKAASSGSKYRSLIISTLKD